MNGARVDSLDKYFKINALVEKTSTWLLYTSILLAFLVVSFPELNLLLVIITVLYFFSTNSLSLYLLPKTLQRRNKHLLAESLGVPLTDETTNLYYNNNIPPSLWRLAANVFENSMFSKTVTSKMVVGERVKVSIVILAAIYFVANRTTSIEFVGVIAQTLLSTTILTNWVRLEILRRKFDEVYEGFRDLFLAKKRVINPTTTSKILDLVLQYHSTNSAMGISLSTKIFRQINPSTTQKWERIKETYNIP